MSLTKISANTEQPDPPTISQGIPEFNPTWPEIGDFWAKSTFFQLFLVISA
jgi:hypothetical protein